MDQETRRGYAYHNTVTFEVPIAILTAIFFIGILVLLMAACVKKAYSEISCTDDFPCIKNFGGYISSLIASVI